MKKFFCSAVTLLIICSSFSQGKYAGSLKSMIGKSFTDERNIPGLKGWITREGTIITPVNDPESMAVDVLQKGTTYAVIFAYQEDSSRRDWLIVDIIEIKNVTKAWQIKTATCSRLDQPDIEIVAVAKTVLTEKIKTIREAWRLNRDKRRVEKIPIKGVTCINEGLD